VVFPKMGEVPKKTGRPRMEDRKAMNAIFYILRTGRCLIEGISEGIAAGIAKIKAEEDIIDTYNQHANC
jgi:hypothetical protein